METRKYEITYIIRPDIEESAKSELVDRFDKVLTDKGLVNSPFCLPNRQVH